MDDNRARLEHIVARATKLYSRPTVAVELLQLIDQPQVDAHALKECVERDPALACKILRVVNSSLFGLSGEVGDLNQAVAMLGTKPLKLLVLGFSLPDELYTGVAAQQLQWYWTTTLTRAVSARLIAERLWHHASDEAFTVGLLQDIGILALVNQLGESYAKFLSGVIEEKCQLASLERETLGFDHVELSAAMLTTWHLPQKIIDTIAMPKQTARLARLPAGEAELPQIVHLAEMLAQLVGQRRLNVLPELLEAGVAYRDLTKPRLTELVEELQPQVDQLAEVLSLELLSERDYVHVLFEAHDHMSLVSEDVVGGKRKPVTDDTRYRELLAHSAELTGAMQSFLGGKPEPAVVEEPELRWEHQHAPHESVRGARCTGGADPNQITGTLPLLRRLAAAADHCRQQRLELSLLLVEPSNIDARIEPRATTAVRAIRRVLNEACAPLDRRHVAIVPLPEHRTALILLDCERRAAVEIANVAIGQLAPSAHHEEPGDDLSTLAISAGVATVSGVPKNFDPWRLWESAERCLYAARLCGTSAVKSIEV